LEEARLHAPRLGYPIMLKLSVSYAGLGVRKVDDDSELAAAWSDLHADRQVVLQRHVGGKLGNTAVLYSRGRPLASMSALKSRRWPGPFGPSAARELMHHDAIDDVVDRFGARSKYDGFCAFDWILDSRDDLNVIELNARPVPALHLAKHVGVDFAEVISESLHADLLRATSRRVGNVRLRSEMAPFFRCFLKIFNERSPRPMTLVSRDFFRERSVTTTSRGTIPRFWRTCFIDVRRVERSSGSFRRSRSR
jgi:predicted ATP-grasp superfamily ATP-dependent carboligase